MRLCINPSCKKPENSDDCMSCQDCQSDLLLDGQYIVLKFISKGGYAKIYEVKDSGNKKILKVLTRVSDNTARHLFKLEKDILKDPDITGVPKLFDYFEYQAHNSNQSIPCIIMQRINGLNLEDWLQKRGNKPINPKRAVNWLKQLTLTLHSVHQKGYFHRDIKPSNIMLDSDGKLILIDFGIGRKITTTLPEKIKSGNVTKPYSAGYAPLEQQNGQASPQSDFFALGRTFIHLLTGNHPDNMANPPHLNANTDEDWDWRSETQDCPEILLDFIDYLSNSSRKKRPKDTLEILQKLENIEKQFFSSTENQRAISTTLKSTNLTFKPGKHPNLGILASRHSMSVTSLAISSDGKTLISGSGDKSLKIWDVESGELVKALPNVHSSNITSVKISPKLDYFASCSNDKRLCIWDYSNYRNLRNWTHPSSVVSLAIDPSGSCLVSACLDGYIRVWNIQETQPIQEHPKTTSSAHPLIITPDGQAIISGHGDKKIIVWQHFELSGHSQAVSALSISLDGQYLVSGSQKGADGEIFLWNLATKEIVQKFIGHCGAISSLVICPNNRFIVSASFADGDLKIWDIHSGEELQSITAHTSGINTLAMTPDGKTIYSGSKDYSIKSWNID